MANCSANDNSLNPPKTTPPQIPNFGSPFAPTQIPISDLQLPTEIIEDIVGLVNKLGLQLPSGLLKPNADGLIRNVNNAISNLFTQFAPFLSFYNLIQAALNLFKCIIEILCAIPDPFAIALKLKKLFSECLPPFMALFPATALIAMIISLMLLILALVEYIIATIIAVIEDLVKNLDVLSKAVELNDAESALAAAQKIAALLCSIQNILAVLIALAAIISVIETLAKIASGTICADGDADGCCPENICPPFIKTTPNGIEVKSGKLIYFKQIGIDAANALSIPANIAAIFSFPPIRTERWQVYDKIGTASFPISSIITPILGNVFWPELPDFSSTLSLRKAPYTVDLTITLDPKDFGLTDLKGSRKFTIKNCVVVRRPYLGVYYYSNLFQPTPTTGTLNIEGGLVYEEDGSSYMIGTTQATLNTFLHQDTLFGSGLPSSDDSFEFDVEFTWKPNAGALAGYQLTTVGCMPEVNTEKAVQNSIIIANGIGAIIDKLPPAPTGERVLSTGFLPNIQGTLDCTNNAIAEFRKNVSKETAAIFQATIDICLNDLKNQTTATLCAALLASVSIFKSTVLANPQLQFTSRTVEIKVILNDPSGINIATNIPQSCADQLAAKLTAETTLGITSKFVYDGFNSFISQISSENAGIGTITVLFDKKVLSKIVPGVVGGSATAIEEQLLNYTFVDAGVSSPTRRDEKDNK